MGYLIWGLPILAGIAEAVSQGVMRLTSVHRFTLIAAGYALALPYYFIWLAQNGVGTIQPSFWIILAIHVPLWAAATTLIVESRRLSPLTLTTPLTSVTLVLLLVTSPLTETGTPNLWGALGILVITAGLYVTYTANRDTGFLQPLLRIRSDRGSMLMLAAMTIAAFTANLDLLALRRAGAPVYLIADHGLIALIAAIASSWYSRDASATTSKIWRSWRVSGWVYALYGLTIALSVIPHMLAFTWLPNVPYVAAAKRTGSVVATFLIGLVISRGGRLGSAYLDEREDLRWRFLGTLFTIVGVVVIFFGKNQ